MNCLQCDFKGKSLKSLSKHLAMKHGMNKSETTDYLFLNLPEYFKKCVNCNVLFKKLKTAGGPSTCSRECSVIARKNINKGRTQSKETIRKRIKSTNQAKKEKSRQDTMMNKYGKLYYISDIESRNKKISNALLGKKHTKEHHKKVIESKRKNNTLRHSNSTKSVIRSKLLSYYQTGDDQSVTIGTSNGRGHVVGKIKGIHYRSSYELIFIKFCLEHNIQLVSAENKKYRVRYSVNGKKHWYYPDFYIPKLDMIIEIKPSKMINYGNNTIKINAGKLKYNNFVVLTENELIDKNKLLSIVSDLEHNNN